MGRRYAPAAGLLLGIVAVVAVVGRLPEPAPSAPSAPAWDSAQVRIPAERDDSTAWRRENLYLYQDNRSRTPVDLPNPDQHPSGPHPNPDRIRILALGDSFTWGHGTYDLDVRWPNELEEELNARTAPGTFEVVVAAEPGTGPALWLDWFDDGLLDADDWDAIVLGIVYNDAIIRGDERSICADGGCTDLFLEQTDEMRRCLSGQDGIAGLLTRLVGRVHPETGSRMTSRRCDLASLSARTGLVSEWDGQRNPGSLPYWPEYLRSLERLRSRTANTPTVAFQAAVDPEQLHLTGLVRAAMEDAGFTFRDLEASLRIVEDGGVDGMFANDGAVEHPGPALTRLYADDLADAILPILPAGRLGDALVGATPPSPPLISNSLPAALSVRQGSREAVVRYEPDTDPGAQFAIPDSQDRSVLRPSPVQRVPCAEIGRPHLRIMLRRDLEPGTALTIRNQANAPYDLIVTGYDGRGTPTSGTVIPVEPDGSVTFEVGGEVARGLLLAPRGSYGCPEDLPIDLGPARFTLLLGGTP